LWWENAILLGGIFEKMIAEVDLMFLRKGCTEANNRKQELRACPHEDQAEVIHAISTISVKLGQIEGHTQ